jgi:hypothetical protein
MLMRLYHVRFTEQIETADAAAVMGMEVILSVGSGRLRVLIDFALRELRKHLVGLLFFG